MFWNIFFLPSFLILVLIAGLHWFGTYENYYIDIGWYDTVLHFLGGVWTGLSIVWIIYGPYGKKLQPFLRFVPFLAAVFAVGIFWEWLELYLRFHDMNEPGYFFDTVKDLIMDMMGGSFGWFFYRLAQREK